MMPIAADMDSGCGSACPGLPARMPILTASRFRRLSFITLAVLRLPLRLPRPSSRLCPAGTGVLDAIATAGLGLEARRRPSRPRHLELRRLHLAVRRFELCLSIERATDLWLVCFSWYLSYHTPFQILLGFVVGATSAVVHCGLTEILPRQTPQGAASRARAAVLSLLNLGGEWGLEVTDRWAAGLDGWEKFAPRPTNVNGVSANRLTARASTSPSRKRD